MEKSLTIFRFGPYELRPRTRELYKQGIKLKLRPQPFQVLNLLVERAGDVVTREELRELLWSAETYVDFEHGLNTAIKELRGVLNDSASEPRYIETLPRLGYRIVAAVDTSEPPIIGKPPERMTPDTDSVRLPMPPNGQAAPSIGNRWKVISPLAFALVALAVGGWWASSRKAHALTDRDTIVLADFTNTTGDPVFDETLKQALFVELTQSPFLNVASDLKVSEMLRRMGRSPEDPFTREVAREVCLRLGGKAILAGSISSLGSHYVVGLQVLGCGSGDILVASQTEAANKETVLKAVDGVASQVRGKLGESLSSLEKYDFPLDTTTKSLEALKAFSMGLRALRERGEGEAIPFLRDAIQRDPEFALAHVTLGRAYWDVGEENEAVDHFTKAFELRERLSEREKYYITTLYNETVSGDMDRAKEAGELWTHVYPRDAVAREKLATLYNELGEVETANLQAQEALKLDPDSTINVFNAVVGAAALNRMDEAGRILQAAQVRGLAGPVIHDVTYLLAFLRGDRAEMERQMAWAAGQGDAEYLLFSEHSDTQAYYGRMREARDLSRHAVASATRSGAKEAAALCEIAAALRELEVGNTSLAKHGMHSALALLPSRAVKVLAALGLARSGETAQAKALIQELESQNPFNTLIKSYWLPTLEASLEVRADDPQTAIARLQGAAPYELAEASGVSNLANMYPTYVRGQAYLMAHNGNAAAAEFKKLLDHSGVVINSILGALSRLQLARAEVMMGDREAARKRYSDFLALWKDADPDIPILIAAKSEYAKLH